MVGAQARMASVTMLAGAPTTNRCPVWRRLGIGAGTKWSLCQFALLRLGSRLSGVPKHRALSGCHDKDDTQTCTHSRASNCFGAIKVLKGMTTRQAFVWRWHLFRKASTEAESTLWETMLYLWVQNSAFWECYDKSAIGLVVDIVLTGGLILAK
jgi:hypothetical protein